MTVCTKSFQILRQISFFFLGKLVMGHVPLVPLRRKQLYFCRRTDLVIWTSFNLMKYFIWYTIGFHCIKMMSAIVILMIMIATKAKQITFLEILSIIIVLILDLCKLFYNWVLNKDMQIMDLFLDNAEALQHCQIISNHMNIPYNEVPITIQSSIKKDVISFKDPTQTSIGLIQLIVIARALKLYYYMRSKRLKLLYISYNFYVIGILLLLEIVLFTNPKNILIHYFQVIIGLAALQYLNLLINTALWIITSLLFLLISPLYQIYVCFQKKVQQQKRLQQIQKFKSYKLKFEDLKRSQSLECIICFQPLNVDDDVMKLPCHNYHIFHESCLKQWFRKDSLSCPYCRKTYQQYRQQFEEVNII